MKVVICHKIVSLESNFFFSSRGDSREINRSFEAEGLSEISTSCLISAKWSDYMRLAERDDLWPRNSFQYSPAVRRLDPQLAFTPYSIFPSPLKFPPRNITEIAQGHPRCILRFFCGSESCVVD